MNEFEQFCHDESVKRGINPGISAKVAWAEGGLDVPARRGTFDTGSSWWAFQLHYGGRGYEYLGTVAGMGNDFTKLTGWRPGDPNAWRDAMRYALDGIADLGWGRWYGAAAVGVGHWDGIQDTGYRTQPGEWDYQGASAPGPRVRVVGTEGLGLRVRSEPHVNASIMASLSEGSEVRATSDHAWRQIVLLDGRIGYVAGTYTEDV